MAVECISDTQFGELLVLAAFYDASFGIKIFPQGGFPVACHKQESSDCHLKDTQVSGMNIENVLMLPAHKIT